MLIRSTVLAIAVAVLGCNTSMQTTTDAGGGGSAAQGGAGGAASGPGGGAPVSECPDSGSCVVASCELSLGESCAFEWSCELDEPCGRVEFVRDEADSSISLSTPAEATCVLEALRDGNEGSYSWYITGMSIPGQYFTSKTVHVRPARVALLSSHQGADLSQFRSHEGPTALQEPDYFERCLAETDAGAIFDCLQDAVPASCG